MPTITKTLPVPSFTVPELEKLLDLPSKAGYRLIREHQINAERDAAGQLRIPYQEAIRFMVERG